MLYRASPIHKFLLNALLQKIFIALTSTFMPFQKNLFDSSSSVGYFIEILNPLLEDIKENVLVEIVHLAENAMILTTGKKMLFSFD